MKAPAGDASASLAPALAHELRTPLGAIQAWAHFLQGRLGDGDAQVARALEGILEAVEQQVRVIARASARDR